MRNYVPTLSIGLILLLFVFSCEEKSFQFIMPLDEEIEIQINENDGAFVEETIVDYQDFADDLDDLEEGVVIERVDIEAVILKPSGYQQGLQGLDDLNFTIIVNGEDYPVYVDQSIILQAGEEEIVVSSLVAQGVQKLGEILKNYAIGDDMQPFTLISSGVSMPAGTPLSMNLGIEIKATLVFRQELETPFFMGE